MKKFTFALLSLLLSACAAASPTPSATPKATVAATPERVTSTPTPLDTTATPSVTEAPTITPKPSDTTIPSETVDITEKAYNVRATDIAQFSITCNSSNQEKNISPDKNWLAVSCIFKQDSSFEIVNRQASKRWILQLKDYAGVFDDGHTGTGGFTPEHWSQDSQYLYFTFVMSRSGGEVCYSDKSSDGMYRLTLNDGSISTLLPAMASYSGYEDISFSPTGRRFAYGDGDLHIFDLQSGANLTIREGASLNNLTWSADGLTLIYTTCVSHSYSVLDKSAIKAFSVEKQQSSTIFEMEKSFIHLEDWSRDGVLKILTTSEDYKDFSTRFFDLASEQWIIATSTTAP
jgi:hypothetical protein